MHRNILSLTSCTAFVPLLLGASLAWPAPANAATLCVDQHGKQGCYTTIAAAVAAASPGDTVSVSAGVYHEDVAITTPVQLIGEDRRSTIIDATGLANGIFVNGFSEPDVTLTALNEIVVTGFTVRNAGFEGILLSNVSNATVMGNNVIHNDQALRNGVCMGLPAFETAEGANCGAGIHLIGSVHSSVTGNYLSGNAGGVLVSDETTTSHDVLVSRNLILNNRAAAGIVLESNPAYFAPGEPQQSGAATLAFGVYDVLVAQNISSGNAEGVAVFALYPAARAYANQIVGNRLFGNSGPGILLGTGPVPAGATKGPDTSRNTITGNFIAQNGADSSAANPAATGIAIDGPSPVIDTLITNNVVRDETIDVAFNSASSLDMHLNDLLGKAGVANLNPLGTVNATENFWGCAKGPGYGGCSVAVGGTTVIDVPFLSGPVDPNEGLIFDPLFDLLQGLGRDCLDDWFPL